MKTTTAKKSKAGTDYTPVPVAIPNKMLEEIRSAATHMQSSQAEIMRLAMNIGLRTLNAARFDVAGALMRLVESDAAKPPPPARARKP